MTSKVETLPALRPSAPVAVRAELSIEELVAQVAKIQQAMSTVMKVDEHYGTIPGTPKPTLYKAGAEKLALLFRLDPEYESTEAYDGAHLTVKSKCTIYHITSGDRLGSGEGSCSTKETKYAYRQGKRKCPKCGAETIFKSKYPPRDRPAMKPGWFCWKEKGGCSANFDHDAPSITNQSQDRIVNPDLPDCYNTVLKMANKRALVAAVLNVTAASDIFTQDIEDLPMPEPAAQQQEQPQATKPQPRRSREEKPADLEDGFGPEPTADTEPPPIEDAPSPEDADAYITADHVKRFKAKLNEKAKALGLTPEGIQHKLLSDFGVDGGSSKNITRRQFPDVMLALHHVRKQDIV